MNREELSEAILELADTPHMAAYALGNALQRLELLELAAVFDDVADHRDLTTSVARVLERGVDVDLAELRRRGPFDGSSL